VSGEAAGVDIDLRSVSEGTVPNIEGGPELLAFADALGLDPTIDPTAAREALIAEFGSAAAERAAGVAATFQMMNRLLDGVGAPVNNRPHFAPVAEAMGFHLADISK
jgi:hypothetical protein